MHHRLKVTLLVPSWNEIDGIKQIMPRIPRNCCDQIVILDGGSTDGTVEWCRDRGFFVYIQKQRGLRQAYTEVWPMLTGDVVITFSPDGNSIPELIPVLIEKMREDYDLVVVSRYLATAKSGDDSRLTRFGNWLFTAVVNCLYRGHCTDSMVIFRAYKRSLAYTLELDKDEGYGMAEWLFGCRISWELLLTVRALKRKCKFAEIPGDEPPRIGGQEKRLIWRWGAAFMFQIVREAFFWR